MIPRDEILSMAREAGIEVHPRKEIARIGLDVLTGCDSTDKLAKFAELATAKERTSRIEAQQRLADMQEMAAKAGLAHRKAVQAAVAEAVAAEREKKTSAWIDAAFRNMIAKRLYSQIRVEFDHRIGPWETFDAEAQQRIVDAIKPDGAT